MQLFIEQLSAKKGINSPMKSGRNVSG